MSPADSKPRVFVDANVLLDVVLHRSRYVQDALRVMALGFNGRAVLVTTASVAHTVRDVAVRSRGRAALEVLDAVLRQVTFIPETVDSVRAGLSFDDPEDASFFFCAQTQCVRASGNTFRTIQLTSRCAVE